MSGGGAVAAIELIDVTKRYGDAVALDGISLQIESGEFFCLLGPSGCGKTTTLNLIGGFIPLTSGELRIEGRRVNDLPPHKRNVNTVFQSYALFPHMTTAQNVAFGLRMSGVDANETAARVTEYLSLVGLEKHHDRYPTQLSGGQQQRVALARALIKRPAVLLLDEPLGALDLKLRKQMQVELSRIHRQVRTTFVYVTHDQEEALSMGTRIAVMSAGRAVQTGTPHELYYHPVDRFVADFIGESNFFEGERVVDGGAARIRLSDGTAVPAPVVGPAGPATLMVRPECIRIGNVPDETERAVLVGRLVNVAFLGSHTRMTVQTAAGSVVALRPHSDGSRSAGLEGQLDEEVSLWWSPQDSTVLVAQTRGGIDGPAA